MQRIVFDDFDYKTDNVDFEKCLDILLNYRNIDIIEQDERKSSTLHYALLFNDSKAVLELLKRGANIGVRNRCNQITISNINAKLLEKHFDTCITSNSFGTQNNDGIAIIFNFKNLIPAPNLQTENIADEMGLIKEKFKIE